MALPTLNRAALLLACAIVLSVAGASVSWALLDLHDGHAGQITGGIVASLCHATEDGISPCVASARSAWAEVSVPLPGHRVALPIAFLSLSYFLSMGVWYAFVGSGSPAWRALRWLPIGVMAAAAYASLFFVSLMAMGRSPWCGGCVAVHAINVLLITTGVLLLRSEPKEVTAPAIGRRQTVAVIVIAILLIAILFHDRTSQVAVKTLEANVTSYREIIEPIQADPQLLLDVFLRQPRHEIARPPTTVGGRPKHELVIFLDLQCSTCRANEMTVHGLIANDFGATLGISLRHFPLCSDCNPFVPRTVHPKACLAAETAEAARIVGGQDAFDRMADLLLADDADLDIAGVRDLATLASLDPDQIVAHLKDPSVARAISADVALGHSIGVDSTPTMFLDGRLVPPICLTPAFWSAVSKLAPDDPRLN